MDRIFDSIKQTEDLKVEIEKKIINAEKEMALK
jgi:hypothetical protein